VENSLGHGDPPYICPFGSTQYIGTGSHPCRPYKPQLPLVSKGSWHMGRSEIDPYANIALPAVVVAFVVAVVVVLQHGAVGCVDLHLVLAIVAVEFNLVDHEAVVPLQLGLGEGHIVHGHTRAGHGDGL